MIDIPIILNNFNRLTTTKKLADDLYKLGYTNIHILDNDSTYQPLLDWYDKCPYKVVRMGKNHGQLAIYNSGYINEFQGWVAYSDSDIELNPNTPRGFVEKMIEVAEKYGKLKVGLALRIDDIPDTVYGRYVKKEEEKFWRREVADCIYEADVDTTFSIIKVGQPFQYQALRIAGDLTARHIPWYNGEILNEEEAYVMWHSDPEFSTTKRFVDSKTKQ